MLIQCTKRACERLKITPPVAATEYNPLYSWRLNVVEEGRKRLVVFMHDISRYCVALDGIKAKDWPKLSKIFTERLRNVMLAEQINPVIIDRYFSNAGEVEYFRNNNTRMTSWLNKACEAAALGYRNHENDVDISLFASRFLVGTKNEKDYWEPREKFHACLSEYGLPLKRCRAFELDVKLQTHNGMVRRTIIVPAAITFEQLATAIKRAYGWWRRENQYHFLLYGGNGFPELYLREEQDPSSFGLPAVVMTGIRLSEYLPKHKVLRFLYDYRADWPLLINLTAEHDDYIGEIPRLVSGEGNSPPEDIGGADGYAEFLDKLKNGKYAERQGKARWGKSYGYEEFDFEKTSREVERSLRW
jgi:hypothetical protein